VVWLQHNPGFEAVPKGYVVHHLDHDELNNDISNLALMQKFHHIAHHAKQKTVKTEVNIKAAVTRREFFIPSRKPYAGKTKSSNGKFQYVIIIYEKIEGKSHRTQLYRWRGKKFRSIEDGEAVSAAIWDEFNREGTVNAY